MKYKINEIFYSIQGEGYYTGHPAIFIRLSGCNLNCDFCDTKHEDNREYSINDILKAIKDFPCNHIVITGGEPSVAENLKDLIYSLKLKNYFIQVETNGTEPIIADWITCSPKRQNDFSFFPAFTDELKYVITPDFNFDYIYGIEKWNIPIYLQPESNKQDNIELCLKKIKENSSWKLSLQIHKLMNIR